MSENQWLIVNGYDSRNAENRYFQSKNKELKFTGKVFLTMFQHNNNTPIEIRKCHFLSASHKKTKNKFTPDNQFLFINAWNEWGEGCHLEPDQANGYAYLQILKELIQG